MYRKTNEGGRKRKKKEREKEEIGEENEGKGRFVLLTRVSSLKLNHLSRIAASRCTADEGNTSSSGISERRPTRPALIERDTRGYRAPSSSTDPVPPFPASNGAPFLRCVWILLVDGRSLTIQAPFSPEKNMYLFIIHEERSRIFYLAERFQQFS